MLAFLVGNLYNHYDAIPYLMTAEILRLLLIGFLFAMFLLAVLYLRRRRLSPTAYVLWVLLALLVPILGPFLVILARPGEPARETAPQGRQRDMRQ